MIKIMFILVNGNQEKEMELVKYSTIKIYNSMVFSVKV